MKINILYEDQDLIVVHKPAGIAVQTGKVGQQDVVSELKNHIATEQKKTGAKAGAPFVGVVHRLDQPVEGVLVFGKTPKATAELNKQLQNQTLNKHYYAVVCGKPLETKKTRVDYLVKDKDNTAKVVSKDFAEAKKAILEYNLLSETIVEQKWEISNLDIQIETGRFHQIRVQMANAGFPLVGDSKYGTDNSQNASMQMGVRNVALCAYHLAFTHPITNKKMEYTVKPQNKAFTFF